MNKKVKEKWVKALRSGKYKKAKKVLHTESGYCCLGVLCDIYRKETGRGKWVKEKGKGKVYFKFVNGTEEKAKTLPDKVMKWAGLIETSPHLNGSFSLAAMNDAVKSNHGKSFKEIADIIEKEL